MVAIWIVKCIPCQEERRISVSFGKCVPVKAEKKLALVQPWMEGEDDLQTLEEIPATLKTQSGLCSLSHSGSLSSQRGGSGMYLWWFSFPLEEGNGWGVTSVLTALSIPQLLSSGGTRNPGRPKIIVADRLAIHQILSFAPKAHREMTFPSLLFSRGCSFQFTHSVVSDSL